MSKIVTKFKTVSPDRYDAFNELYQKDENIMPCELYVDKTTGTIYFIEQERKSIRGMRRELSIFDDYCSGDIENPFENFKKI